MRKPFADPHKVMPARAVLADCAIPLGADFHALNSYSVDRLLEHARMGGYRKPKNANGSRAQYYHAMLQRRACGVTEADARIHLNATPKPRS